MLLSSATTTTTAAHFSAELLPCSLLAQDPDIVFSNTTTLSALGCDEWYVRLKTPLFYTSRWGTSLWRQEEGAGNGTTEFEVWHEDSDDGWGNPVSTLFLRVGGVIPPYVRGTTPTAVPSMTIPPLVLSFNLTDPIFTRSLRPLSSPETIPFERLTYYQPRSYRTPDTLLLADNEGVLGEETQNPPQGQGQPLTLRTYTPSDNSHVDCLKLLPEDPLNGGTTELGTCTSSRRCTFRPPARGGVFSYNARTLSTGPLPPDETGDLLASPEFEAYSWSRSHCVGAVDGFVCPQCGACNLGATLNNDIYTNGSYPHLLPSPLRLYPDETPLRIYLAYQMGYPSMKQPADWYFTGHDPSTLAMSRFPDGSLVTTTSTPCDPHIKLCPLSWFHWPLSFHNISSFSGDFLDAIGLNGDDPDYYSNLPVPETPLFYSTTHNISLPINLTESVQESVFYRPKTPMLIGPHSFGSSTRKLPHLRRSRTGLTEGTREERARRVLRYLEFIRPYGAPPLGTVASLSHPHSGGRWLPSADEHQRYSVLSCGYCSAGCAHMPPIVDGVFGVFSPPASASPPDCGADDDSFHTEVLPVDVDDDVDDDDSMVWAYTATQLKAPPFCQLASVGETGALEWNLTTSVDTVPSAATVPYRPSGRVRLSGGALFFSPVDGTHLRDVHEAAFVQVRAWAPTTLREQEESLPLAYGLLKDMDPWRDGDGYILSCSVDAEGTAYSPLWWTDPSQPRDPWRHPNDPSALPLFRGSASFRTPTNPRSLYLRNGTCPGCLPYMQNNLQKLWMFVTHDELYPDLFETLVSNSFSLWGTEDEVDGDGRGSDFRARAKTRQGRVCQTLFHGGTLGPGKDGIGKRLDDMDDYLRHVLRIHSEGFPVYPGGFPDHRGYSLGLPQTLWDDRSPNVWLGGDRRRGASEGNLALHYREKSALARGRGMSGSSAPHSQLFGTLQTTVVLTDHMIAPVEGAPFVFAMELDTIDNEHNLCPLTSPNIRLDEDQVPDYAIPEGKLAFSLRAVHATTGAPLDALVLSSIQSRVFHAEVVCAPGLVEVSSPLSPYTEWRFSFGGSGVVELRGTLRSVAPALSPSSLFRRPLTREETRCALVVHDITDVTERPTLGFLSRSEAHWRHGPFPLRPCGRDYNAEKDLDGGKDTEWLQQSFTDNVEQNAATATPTPASVTVTGAVSSPTSSISVTPTRTTTNSMSVSSSVSPSLSPSASKSTGGDDDIVDSPAFWIFVAGTALCLSVCVTAIVLIIVSERKKRSRQEQLRAEQQQQMYR